MGDSFTHGEMGNDGGVRLRTHWSCKCQTIHDLSNLEEKEKKNPQFQKYVLK